MKKLGLIIITTAFVCGSGCSKKEPKPEQNKRAENPKSNYGKALKKAEDTVNQTSKNNEDYAETIEE